MNAAPDDEAGRPRGARISSGSLALAETAATMAEHPTARRNRPSRDAARLLDGDGSPARAHSATEPHGALLSISDLRVEFRQEGDWQRVVDGVSFQIRRGETFALVGESGSGKSVTALSVLRLLPANARISGGSIRLGGRDLLDEPELVMTRIRGNRIGIIFQDPMSALNPVLTIGQQIAEVLRPRRAGRADSIQRRALELMDWVGLPDPSRHFRQYPHQLSGGMRQRAMIAMALAGEPELLIADEPTTALDVTIQAQILALLQRLQSETGMALWLITHDFGVVAELCQRLAVMRDGRIVETGGKDFFHRPEHPYSQSLLAAMPRLVAASRPNPGPVARDGTLLEVSDLRVHYPLKGGLLQRTVGTVRAVDGVSFKLGQGETLALVGESGCGKTTLGKAILGLITPTAGEIFLDGLLLNGAQRQAAIRAALQIVFQDPASAMNPRLVVGEIIAEGLRALRPDLRASERENRVGELLEAVGIPKAHRFRYPHEFSGGQRQRICIARALAVQPKLVICDEPTSALDVSVQAQIIGLLRDLQTRHGLSYVFITHDLALVAELAHRVAVMRDGRIVECGPTTTVLTHPDHPYTRDLLAAVPRLRRGQPPR